MGQPAVVGVALLSEEFLAKYKDRHPDNAGVLFLPVYLRTYSRYIPELKRRERWWETVRRVVEYSMSLYQGPASRKELQAEAEDLYDHIFNLKVIPAGRTLWIGGTEVTKKHGDANYNCSAAVIDELEIFGDLFHLQMNRCGTGFRILPEDVEKLPELDTNFSIEHQPYYPVPKVSRRERSLISSSDRDTNFGEYVYVVEIGDSREGWVGALRHLFTFLALMGKINKEFGSDGKYKLKFIYNNIRPQGERIKSFGGRAPGPDGLRKMFENMEQVIKRCNGKLRPIDCLDIMNFMGQNTVAGGTGRAAQVGLGSPDDLDFVLAKKDLWIKKDNLQRIMSNNSVVLRERPTKQQLNIIFDGIKNNGEPGFFNLSAAKKRLPSAEVSNPCLEVELSNRGFCNLSCINLMAFIEDGMFNLPAAVRAIRLATRIGCRMTNTTVSLPKWDEIQKRDRLCGVSMTGIMDCFDAMGIEFDSEGGTTLLHWLRQSANQEADQFSKEMGINRPKLVTTIKPEGTVSQLPTVSCGLHRNFSPYFIRRVRVSSIDPVCAALQELGVPNEPDQGKAERVVFSFPIKSGAKQSASAEPARRQFERYLTMQKYYTDHNSSCTLTVGEDEWEEVINLVHDNWDDVIAVSFLPKNTTAYPQMPYEEISEEQYKEMMKTFPDLSNLDLLVDRYEIDGEEDELDSDCSSGVCPTR